ncbi:hypothetical protein IJ556_07415 [bacterium]|nr:hypothetical protein [bacterium]
MFKRKARKPILNRTTYLKFGFVITEHTNCHCPRCKEILNAGPNYQPKYCDRCGQKVDFTDIQWEEDRDIGYAKEGTYESFKN